MDAYVPQVSVLDSKGFLSQAWLQWFLNPKLQTINLEQAIGVTSGGTGLSTPPATGTILVGNGTGYDLDTTLPISALPALIGDVTSSAGNNTTTLETVNNTPGTFVSATITVDGKGRITNATDGSAAQASTVNGRLTLQSGTAIPVTDQIGKTTIYFTPYKGNRIALWNGTTYTVVAFAETSLPLGTVVSGTCYDVFGFLNAGVLGLEKLAWASSTARATALAVTDGRLCKSGDQTRLYLGTFIATSTTTTEDSGGGTTTQVGGKRFLWNYYNRISRPFSVIDTTSTWAYNTNTWRQANGAAGNKVEYVIGYPEDQVQANLVVGTSNTNTSRASLVSIASNSTTTPSKFIATGYSPGPSFSYFTQPTMVVNYQEVAQLGYQYLAWIENGGDGTSNFAGTYLGAQFGMTGSTYA